MGDGRYELTGEESRAMLFEAAVALGSDEVAEIAAANQLHHQIIHVAVLQHEIEIILVLFIIQSV